MLLEACGRGWGNGGQEGGMVGGQRGVDPGSRGPWAPHTLGFALRPVDQRAGFAELECCAVASKGGAGTHPCCSLGRQGRQSQWDLQDPHPASCPKCHSPQATAFSFSASTTAPGKGRSARPCSSPTVC